MGLDYIFYQKFGYGVLDDTLSSIDDILNTRVAKQPTHSENEILNIRKDITKLNRQKNENSKKQRQQIIKKFEADKVDRYIHILNSNQTHNRFIDFWSNHLVISDDANRSVMTPFVGQYNSDIITPFIFGKFEDMLYASAKSMGMLSFLNNIQNIDPNAKIKRKRDINENYARELLELHTLGVDFGYTQTDVTNVSYLLTGWGIRNKDSGFALKVKFLPERTAVRSIDIFGRRFTSGLENSLRDITTFLAHHPSTAEHITRKMFTYFISEDIDKDFHKVLIKTWIQSNGDLAIVSDTLMKYDGLQNYRNAKVRSLMNGLVS